MSSNKKKIGMIMANEWVPYEIGGRFEAMRKYLIKQGHEVLTVMPSKKSLVHQERNKNNVMLRLIRKLSVFDPIPHWLDWFSDEIEAQIRTLDVEVIIATDILSAYVLRKDFNCLKIADMANISFLEKYYKGEKIPQIKKIFEVESTVYEKVDFLLCRHLMAEYLSKYFPAIYRKIKEKMVVIRPGCNFSVKKAEFKYPPKIVYAGGAECHIHDPVLLSCLSNLFPWGIDAYGKDNPNTGFIPARINYQGWQESKDFLSQYQFGLVTASRVLLRHYSISTKFPDYFSYGLPVLFPEWMKEGYTYKGCIPYNEDNFGERIKQYSDREKWAEMSERVLEQAQNLTWDKVLQPLLDVIEHS